MSGSEPVLQAPSAALVEIAKGINLAHAELKELGMIGEASTGRGFSDLALSGLELGHSGLTSEFGTFCERWEWGGRALKLRGNAFAQSVGLSAGAYAEQERYVKDSIKIGVNSLNGNPHLSEDEVKQMSWDTIRDQHAWDGADWSGESFSQAHGEVKQTWRNTAYDVEDSLLDSMERSGAVDPTLREAMDEELKETLAPDQATVDQAEQPRWGSVADGGFRGHRRSGGEGDRQGRQHGRCRDRQEQGTGRRGHRQGHRRGRGEAGWDRCAPVGGLSRGLGGSDGVLARRGGR